MFASDLPAFRDDAVEAFGVLEQGSVTATGDVVNDVADEPLAAFVVTEAGRCAARQDVSGGCQSFDDAHG